MTAENRRRHLMDGLNMALNVAELLAIGSRDPADREAARQDAEEIADLITEISAGGSPGQTLRTEQPEAPEPDAAPIATEPGFSRNGAES